MSSNLLSLAPTWSQQVLRFFQELDRPFPRQNRESVFNPLVAGILQPEWEALLRVDSSTDFRPFIEKAEEILSLLTLISEKLDEFAASRCVPWVRCLESVPCFFKNRQGEFLFLREHFVVNFNRTDFFRSTHPFSSVDDRFTQLINVNTDLPIKVRLQDLKTDLNAKQVEIKTQILSIYLTFNDVKKIRYATDISRDIDSLIEKTSKWGAELYALVDDPPLLATISRLLFSEFLFFLMENKPYPFNPSIWQASFTKMTERSWFSREPLFDTIKPVFKDYLAHDYRIDDTVLMKLRFLLSLLRPEVNRQLSEFLLEVMKDHAHRLSTQKIKVMNLLLVPLSADEKRAIEASLRSLHLPSGARGLKVSDETHRYWLEDSSFLLLNALLRQDGTPPNFEMAGLAMAKWVMEGKEWQAFNRLACDYYSRSRERDPLLKIWGKRELEFIKDRLSNSVESPFDETVEAVFAYELAEISQLEEVKSWTTPVIWILLALLIQYAAFPIPEVGEQEAFHEDRRKPRFDYPSRYSTEAHRAYWLPWLKYYPEGNQRVFADTAKHDIKLLFSPYHDEAYDVYRLPESNEYSKLITSYWFDRTEGRSLSGNFSKLMTLVSDDASGNPSPFKRMIPVMNDLIVEIFSREFDEELRKEIWASLYLEGLWHPLILLMPEGKREKYIADWVRNLGRLNDPHLIEGIVPDFLSRIQKDDILSLLKNIPSAEQWVNLCFHADDPNRAMRKAELADFRYQLVAKCLTQLRACFRTEAEFFEQCFLPLWKTLNGTRYSMSRRGETLRLQAEALSLTLIEQVIHGGNVRRFRAATNLMLQSRQMDKEHLTEQINRIAELDPVRFRSLYYPLSLNYLNAETTEENVYLACVFALVKFILDDVKKGAESDLLKSGLSDLVRARVSESSQSLPYLLLSAVFSICAGAQGLGTSSFTPERCEALNEWLFLGLTDKEFSSVKALAGEKGSKLKTWRRLILQALNVAVMVGYTDTPAQMGVRILDRPSSEAVLALPPAPVVSGGAGAPAGAGAGIGAASAEVLGAGSGVVSPSDRPERRVSTQSEQRYVYPLEVEFALKLSSRQPLLKLINYLFKCFAEKEEKIGWILPLFWRLDDQGKAIVLGKIEEKRAEWSHRASRYDADFSNELQALLSLDNLYKSFQQSKTGSIAMPRSGFFYPFSAEESGDASPQSRLFDLTFRKVPEGGLHGRYHTLRCSLGTGQTWVNFFSRLSAEIASYPSDFYPPKTTRAQHVITLYKELFGRGSMPEALDLKGGTPGGLGAVITSDESQMIQQISVLSILWFSYSEDPESILFRVSKPLLSPHDLPVLSSDMGPLDLVGYALAHIHFMQGLSLSQQAGHFWDIVSAYQNTFELTPEHLKNMTDAVSSAIEANELLAVMFLQKIHERASGQKLQEAMDENPIILALLNFERLPQVFVRYQPEGMGHGSYNALRSQLDQCDSLFKQWEVLLSHQEDSTRPRKWWELKFTRKEWLDGSRGMALRAAISLVDPVEEVKRPMSPEEKTKVTEILELMRWELVTRAPDDAVVHAKHVSPAQQRLALAGVEVAPEREPEPVTAPVTEEEPQVAPGKAPGKGSTNLSLLRWHKLERGEPHEGDVELAARNQGPSGGAGGPGNGHGHV